MKDDLRMISSVIMALHFDCDRDDMTNKTFSIYKSLDIWTFLFHDYCKSCDAEDRLHMTCFNCICDLAFAPIRGEYFAYISTCYGCLYKS